MSQKVKTPTSGEANYVPVKSTRPVCLFIYTKQHDRSEATSEGSLDLEKNQKYVLLATHIPPWPTETIPLNVPKSILIHFRLYLGDKESVFIRPDIREISGLKSLIRKDKDQIWKLLYSLQIIDIDRKIKDNRLITFLKHFYFRYNNA